jgi:hypothetical protein
LFRVNNSMAGNQDCALKFPMFPKSKFVIVREMAVREGRSKRKRTSRHFGMCQFCTNIATHGA